MRIKAFLFFTFYLLLFPGVAHSQDILWEKSYGGKHDELLFDAVATPDFGYLLAGSSLSKKTGSKLDDNRGNLDFWLWKMDENGDYDWQKTLGGSKQDLLKKVILTNDGGYLLAGTSHSDVGYDKKDKSFGDSDFWVIKLTASGEEEWQKTFGGEGHEELTSLIKTKDGGYLIGGSSESDASGTKSTKNYGNLDYWIVKIDSKGEVVWQNSFGGQYSDELNSITQTTDGGYLLGGSSNSPESGNKKHNNVNQSDFWIIRIDDKGQELWQRVIGGNQDDQLTEIRLTIDGNYIIAGNSNSSAGHDKDNTNEDGTDIWVLKINIEGEVLWQKTYNIASVDAVSSIIENQDRTLLISGFAQGELEKKKPKSTAKVNPKGKKSKKYIAGTYDYVTIKIKENGDEIWRKEVGSDGEDLLVKTIEVRDGGYLMVGTSKDGASNDRKSAIGRSDFWVVKLKDKQKPTVVKKTIEAIPNPAFDYTNIVIGYDFTKGTASLVDISGRVLQSFEITVRMVPINLTGLPDGIYIVNIKTDKQNDGVKIIKGNNQK